MLHTIYDIMELIFFSFITIILIFLGMIIIGVLVSISLIEELIAEYKLNKEITRRGKQ